MIIKNDLFNIEKRLKRINKGYFIVFNEKNKVFEVHNKFLSPTFCLRLPYNKLDSRAVEMVKKSEVTNFSKCFEKIEEDNLKLQRKQLEDMKEQMMYDVKMLLF